MSQATLLREINLLARSISRTTAEQARLRERAEEVTTVHVILEPREGPYHGGQFEFEIYCSYNFPTDPPLVTCLTDIYHPNIGSPTHQEEGMVCLNLLEKDMWSPQYTLLFVVQGLLYLLYEPNRNDPLTLLDDVDWSVDEWLFKKKVRQSLRGEEVDGLTFKRNLVGGYESEGEEEEEENDDEGVDEEQVDDVLPVTQDFDTLTL